MNRINQLFQTKPHNIKSVFITAGYPNLNDTIDLVLELELAGVDIIEIGIPFSDPLADGPTIQKASAIALENGMNLHLVLEQVAHIRKKSEIPIVLMGYANPILKFGLDSFLDHCQKTGVDGLIIPDINIEEYELSFKSIFEKYEVPLSFLFSQNTSELRLKKMVNESRTFLYFVSSASTTGGSTFFSDLQLKEFISIQSKNIEIPILMGFGINDSRTFEAACVNFNGGIVGSAFIRSLEQKIPVSTFVESLNF